MDHIPRLSEAVYVGLCREVGSPTEVKIRREVMDTEEVVRKHLCITNRNAIMKSGSKREGFILGTSDTDYMFWPPKLKVICDHSQISLYRIPQHTVILMECDDVQPGFTRLNLINSLNNAIIRASCVVKNHKSFISSTLFRFNILQLIQARHAFFASSIPHGPCSSHMKVKNSEVDYVMCLASDHWPTLALPWIQRSRQQGWPSECVLLEILSGGFHVIPIGSTPESEEEWRISFSSAEQKLVYSMNHCQFLCYGLLKFFLKEVINFQTNDPVLCSYFMKTTVFWVIQSNNSSTWKPEDLLSYFWKCFKLLIYWVGIGECPNFFIPQNNMFRVKVNGSVQTSLFSQLYNLYCKGISCLLLSQTLRSYFYKAVLNRTLRVNIDESTIITGPELDISFFNELGGLRSWGLEEYIICVNQIERLIKERLTPYQAITLQCITSSMLRKTALLIQNSIYADKNRTVYCNSSKVSAMLKFSCTKGFVSDILFLAMYFYRTLRYEHSLSILQKAQRKMSVPFTVYRDNVNIDMYEHYTTGMSLDNKFRRAVVVDIGLVYELIYIDELVLEQKISNKNGIPILFIPPLVMLHMLFILNHHRLGDAIRSQQSLRNLHTLLFYDDWIYVPILTRDISWQILGICQQITGDYLGSLQSYQYSLQQEPFNRIQEATLLRMNTLPHSAM